MAVASDATATNLPRVIGEGIMGGSVLGGWDLNSLITITIINGSGNLDQMACTFRNKKPAHTLMDFIDLRP